MINKTSRRSARIVYLVLILLFVLSVSSYAQLPGTLDATFNNDGKAFAMPASSSIPGMVFNRSSSVTTYNNRIYVAGTSSDDTSEDYDYAGIAAFDLNGKLDASFSEDGLQLINAGSGEYINSIIVQNDGKILLGGFDNSNFLIIRLNQDGSLDTSWDEDGIVTTDFTGTWERINGLALQSDGKLIAAGYSGTTVNDITVARYNTDGTLDTSFGTNGFLNMDLQKNSDRLGGVVIQPDNKILLVGTSSLNNRDGLVMRLDKNGALDTSFNGKGFILLDSGSDDELGGIALQPDNKILVSGERGSGTGGVYRLNSNGTIDTTFGSAGYADSGVGMYAADVAYHSKNKIIMFGYTYGSGESTSRDFAMVSYETNGNLDACFGTNGLFKIDMGNDTEDYATKGAIQSDGKLLLTGQFDTDVEFAITRINGPSIAIDRTIKVSDKTFIASETGATYQWKNCDTNSNIAGETGKSYTALTSGNYQAFITKEGCTVTTSCYHTQDALYAVVNDGVLNSAKGPSLGSAWGDFNSDGFDDLLVVNYAGYANFLLTNNGNKSFSKAVTGDIVTDKQDSYGSTWGDYDNDGLLDLFVSNNSGKNELYHNIGGSFEKITTGDLVNDITNAWDAAWVDYNNDGYLDVFVSTNNNNFLYKGNGTGQFQKITNGAIVNDNEASFSFAWADYNNDGYVDLFVANYGNQNNSLYKNLGNGSFLKIISGAIVNDGGQSRSASWGDYNNDGFMDLFVTNSGQKNFLYKNNGNETFTKILNDPIVNQSNWAFSSTWTDYNNDGYIDMAVVRSTDTDSVTLFKNNKNGSFSRVFEGSLLATNTSSWSIAAADYDNDGYEDLYVAGRGFNKGYLFENQNSINSFLGISLKGIIANRSSIGARVKVKSNGYWQTKQVTAKTGRGSQGSLRLNFGLGNSTTADSIVIFWPGNKRQIMKNTQANQIISITECISYNEVLHRSICMGEVFKFGNKNLTAPGVYTGNYITNQGCDSLVTLNLTVNPIYTNVDISKSICQGETFAFGKQMLSVAGKYTGDFKTVYGCDSTVALTLIVKPIYNGSALRSICEGDIFVFGKQQLSKGGKYTEVFKSTNGCDSTVALTLIVNPKVYTSISKSICQGDTYTFDNKVLTNSGQYTGIFKNFYGCDSTVLLTLTVNPVYRINVSKTICSGDSYLFNNLYLSTAGEYVGHLKTSHGCDSTVILNLNVQSPYETFVSKSICAGESLAFGKDILTTSGKYTGLFHTIYGCDSTVVLTLQVNNLYSGAEVRSICEGETFVFGNQILTSAGEYTGVFKTTYGCDSTVVLTLSINSLDSSITKKGVSLSANEDEASYQWNECVEASLVPISGATSKTFSPAKTGAYAVTINKLGCTKKSDCEEVVITGLEGGINYNTILYPNPAKGILKIMPGTKCRTINIKILNANGIQIVQQLFSDTDLAEVAVDKLSPGLYMVDIALDDVKVLTKFVKE